MSGTTSGNDTTHDAAVTSPAATRTAGASLATDKDLQHLASGDCDDAVSYGTLPARTKAAAVVGGAGRRDLVSARRQRDPVYLPVIAQARCPRLYYVSGTNCNQGLTGAALLRRERMHRRQTLAVLAAAGVELDASELGGG